MKEGEIATIEKDGTKYKVELVQVEAVRLVVPDGSITYQVIAPATKDTQYPQSEAKIAGKRPFYTQIDTSYVVGYRYVRCTRYPRACNRCEVVILHGRSTGTFLIRSHVAQNGMW